MEASEQLPKIEKEKQNYILKTQAHTHTHTHTNTYV